MCKDSFVLSKVSLKQFVETHKPVASEVDTELMKRNRKTTVRSSCCSCCQKDSQRTCFHRKKRRLRQHNKPTRRHLSFQMKSSTKKSRSEQLQQRLSIASNNKLILSRLLRLKHVVASKLRPRRLLPLLRNDVVDKNSGSRVLLPTDVRRDEKGVRSGYDGSASLTRGRTFRQGC